MDSFDLELAYDFLGVTPDASIGDARKAFRRMARKLHPDKRGGDPESFHLLEESFKAVVRALSERDRRLRSYEALVTQNERLDDEMRGAQSMDMAAADSRGEETFSQRFNRVFEQSPAAHDPYKRGYDDRAPEPQPGKVFSSFSKAERAFEEETRGVAHSSLVVYGPPAPMGSALGMFELGVDSVSDFSTASTVDYHRAYSCGRLRPLAEQREGVTFEESKRARAAPVPVGDAESEYDRKQRETDAKRREVVRHRDEENARIYQEANRLMLAGR